jgi:hypothetical protein
VKEFLDVFLSTELCDALRYAHDKWVHRQADHPQNIMVASSLFVDVFENTGSCLEETLGK